MFVNLQCKKRDSIAIEPFILFISLSGDKLKLCMNVSKEGYSLDVFLFLVFF